MLWLMPLVALTTLMTPLTIHSWWIVMDLLDKDDVTDTTFPVTYDLLN